MIHFAARTPQILSLSAININSEVNFITLRSTDDKLYSIPIHALFNHWKRLFISIPDYFDTACETIPVALPSQQLGLIVNWCDFHQTEQQIDGASTWDHIFFALVPRSELVELGLVATELKMLGLYMVIIKVLAQKWKGYSVEDTKILFKIDYFFFI